MLSYKYFEKKIEMIHILVLTIFFTDKINVSLNNICVYVRINSRPIFSVLILNKLLPNKEHLFWVNKGIVHWVLPSTD